jgi:hypothetical protein
MSRAQVSHGTESLIVEQHPASSAYSRRYNNLLQYLFVSVQRKSYHTNESDHGDVKKYTATDVSGAK